MTDSSNIALMPRSLPKGLGAAGKHALMLEDAVETPPLSKSQRYARTVADVQRPQQFSGKHGLMLKNVAENASVGKAVRHVPRLMLKNSAEHSAASKDPVVQVVGGVAVPTPEWKVVPAGVACPRGCEFRMDLKTGTNLVRLPSKLDRRPADKNAALVARRKSSASLLKRKRGEQMPGDVKSPWNWEASAAHVRVEKRRMANLERLLQLTSKTEGTDEEKAAPAARSLLVASLIERKRDEQRLSPARRSLGYVQFPRRRRSSSAQHVRTETRQLRNLAPLRRLALKGAPRDEEKNAHPVSKSPVVSLIQRKQEFMRGRRRCGANLKKLGQGANELTLGRPMSLAQRQGARSSAASKFKAVDKESKRRSVTVHKDGSREEARVITKSRNIRSKSGGKNDGSQRFISQRKRGIRQLSDGRKVITETISQRRVMVLPRLPREQIEQSKRKRLRA